MPAIRVFHFATWPKVRAMQHRIDRSGIARRPMPKLGLKSEEIAEKKREALARDAASNRRPLCAMLDHRGERRCLR
jgi:hypothetical protein